MVYHKIEKNMRIKITGINRLLVGGVKGMRYSLTSHLLPLTSLIALLSCEKEIDIDYHTVPTQYVVEASVTATGMTARLSTTNAMDDNSGSSDISQADITVSGSDGSSSRLRYTSNGFYRAGSTGTPGVTYTLDIDLDGHHFTSTSIMQQKPRANAFTVIRKKIATEWFQMGKLLIQDLPNEDNWYFMHVYRNNIGYRWAVMSDRNDPNKQLQQLFSFFREGSTDSDVLHEGDRLRVEIRAIDQRAYDYLYSMQVMETTGTNPIQNFSGGCLGYFSAYGAISLETVYHAADVVTEEGEN